MGRKVAVLALVQAAALNAMLTEEVVAAAKVVEL
jgi:hypothetical protein